MQLFSASAASAAATAGTTGVRLSSTQLWQAAAKHQAQGRGLTFRASRLLLGQGHPQGCMLSHQLVHLVTLQPASICSLHNALAAGCRLSGLAMSGCARPALCAPPAADGVPCAEAAPAPACSAAAARVSRGCGGASCFTCTSAVQGVQADSLQSWACQLPPSSVGLWSAKRQRLRHLQLPAGASRQHRVTCPVDPHPWAGWLAALEAARCR